MQPIKLDHCVIHVSDWNRSHSFYREVLGAELVPNGKGWAYRFRDVQLNLHGPEQLCFDTDGIFQGLPVHHQFGMCRA